MNRNLYILGGILLPFIPTRFGGKNNKSSYSAQWRRDKTKNGYPYYLVTFEDCDCRTPFYPVWIWANQMDILNSFPITDRLSTGSISIDDKAYQKYCKKVWLECKYKIGQTHTKVMFGNKDTIYIPRNLIYGYRPKERYPIQYRGMLEGSIQINNWLDTNIRNRKS
jgi:hypothetical protein